MKRLITYDRYGYSFDNGDVEKLKGDELIKFVSFACNYWYQEGDSLSDINGDFEFVESKERLREIDIHDCAIAWQNGQDRCQCRHKNCPRYNV